MSVIDRDKAYRILQNYTNYIDNGGRWYDIHTVDEAQVVRGQNTDFHIFRHLKDVTGLELNAVSAKLFLTNYKPQEELSEDEMATGYLGDDFEEEKSFYLVKVSDGKTVSFATSDKVLGRQADRVDFQVKGYGVSRMHCKIKLIDGVPYIQDLGSMNGTKVNGVRIDGNINTEIKENDVILIANEEFRVDRY